MTFHETARLESARLAALRSFEVLDTPADPAFDRLSALARDLLGTEMAVISLIDETRQWFKSKQGLDGCETDREVAFCDHAIRGDAHSIMVVPDARQDPRFRDNPSVIGDPFVRFYAGAVLTTAEGHALGTLCVFDSRPRTGFGETEQRRLRQLADLVMQALEHHRDARRLLRRSAKREARLRLLTDHMADVVTRMRLDGTSDFISPAIERLLGYRPEEMAGRPAQSFVHPEDRAAVMAVMSALAVGMPRKTLQHRAVRKNGAVVWVETSFEVVRDETGADPQPWVVAVIRDISARKALEDALAESEQRYRTLAEHSTDILVRFGVDGLVRYISPACRKLGVDPDNAIGKPVTQVVAIDSQDHTAGIIRGLFSGEEIDHSIRRQHRIVDNHGREVWLEGSPSLVRDEAGKVVEVVTVLRDVTARHRIEQALAESEARYRHLADTAPDIITESRLDGTLTYISPASTAVMGFTPQELLGRSSLAVMSFEDAERMQAIMRRVLASKSVSAPEPIQFRTLTKDGRQIWLECRPAVHRDPRTGKPVGFIDVIRDITQHKALEASLEAARAEAEAAASVKAEFLANMSHELRTPLTAVLGFSKLVAEQPELSEQTSGYVRRLTTAGGALLATVNDILDFSKLEAGQVEIVRVPASPASVIGESVALFEAAAADKGIRVLCEGLDALPATLSLDPDRLRQVLLNLVGNAVKFTETGGVVVRAEWRDGRLACRVVDTGAGIPGDRLGRLFQRFSQVDGSSTRRHGGTGLGLAICKGLVEAMGGEIGARSKPGQGSEFWFELPAAAVGGRAWQGAGIPEGARILLAEDNPMNRELVRAILSSNDVELTEAADGMEAVLAALSEPFDLILMDLRMPRLDGESAAARIRAEPGPNTGIPIVGFSADTDSATPGVFDALVGKPIEAAQLLAVLAAQLNEEPPQEADHEAA